MSALTHAKSARSGFTLIELLVVVAMIAVLAAILFPVFNQAREKGRQSSCLSNVRQIGIATLLYTQDYDETLPLYQYNSLIYWCGGRDSAGQKLDKTRGIIYPYIKSGDIQRCPSFTGGDNLGGTGYGINRRLMFKTGFTPNPASLADLSVPSGTILFGDAGVPDFPIKGQTGETISIEPPSDWLPSPTIEFRHQGMACFAWADGHAKPVRRTDFVKELPPFEQAATKGITYVGDAMMARR
ncbi:MAG: type II secretion system protein [Akkermansiaceae bacterium]|nr:type II secretion system protein [Armatimonadota bacterium]